MSQGIDRYCILYRLSALKCTEHHVRERGRTREKRKQSRQKGANPTVAFAPHQKKKRSMDGQHVHVLNSIESSVYIPQPQTV